jgi:(p)ppGpp synthase/HD superfamily hydrolase
MFEVGENQLDQLYALAREIATNAHHGQFDKGGRPYIEHPIAVADSLESTEHKIIALLHDTLEDTTLTEDDLRNYGFTDSIVKSICVLTKKESVNYEEYLLCIKADSNALHVKIADIKHNMDISRISNPTKNDFERMEKYRKALATLGATKTMFDKTLVNLAKDEENDSINHDNKDIMRYSQCQQKSSQA